MLTRHGRALCTCTCYARHTTMRSRRCSCRSLSAPVSGARLPTTRRRREEQAERGAAQRQRWRHLLPHRLGTPGASTAAVYEATLATATSLVGAADDLPM